MKKKKTTHPNENNNFLIESLVDILVGSQNVFFSRQHQPTNWDRKYSQSESMEEVNLVEKPLELPHNRLK